MKLKGDYNSGTSYSVGDVVRNTEDNQVYHMIKPAKAGTEPKDTRYWNRLSQTLSEVVRFILDGVEMALGVVESYIPDGKTLILGSSTEGSEKQMAITVDDDGEVAGAEVLGGE